MLWKVSKLIQNKGYAGTARLAQIDKFRDPQRATGNDGGSYAKKAKREDDMVCTGLQFLSSALISCPSTFILDR